MSRTGCFFGFRVAMVVVTAGLCASLSPGAPADASMPESLRLLMSNGQRDPRVVQEEVKQSLQSIMNASVQDLDLNVLRHGQRIVLVAPGKGIVSARTGDQPGNQDRHLRADGAALDQTTEVMTLNAVKDRPGVWNLYIINHGFVGWDSKDGNRAYTVATQAWGNDAVDIQFQDDGKVTLRHVDTENFISARDRTTPLAADSPTAGKDQLFELYCLNPLPKIRVWDSIPAPTTEYVTIGPRGCSTEGYWMVNNDDNLLIWHKKRRSDAWAPWVIRDANGVEFNVKGVGGFVRLEAGSDRLWTLGADSGRLCCYDFSLNIVITLSTDMMGGVLDMGSGLSDAFWVVAKKGTFRYSPTAELIRTVPGMEQPEGAKRFVRVPDPGGRPAIAVDVGPDGIAWVVNEDNYIFRWDPGRNDWTPVNREQNSRAYGIAVGHEGQVWTIGLDYAPWRYCAGSKNFIRCDLPPDVKIRFLAAGNAGELWFCGDGTLRPVYALTDPPNTYTRCFTYPEPETVARVYRAAAVADQFDAVMQQKAGQYRTQSPEQAAPEHREFNQSIAEKAAGKAALSEAEEDKFQAYLRDEEAKRDAALTAAAKPQVDPAALKQAEARAAADGAAAKREAAKGEEMKLGELPGFKDFAEFSQFVLRDAAGDPVTAGPYTLIQGKLTHPTVPKLVDVGALAFVGPGKTRTAYNLAYMLMPPPEVADWAVSLGSLVAHADQWPDAIKQYVVAEVDQMMQASRVAWQANRPSYGLIVQSSEEQVLRRADAPQALRDFFTAATGQPEFPLTLRLCQGQNVLFTHNQNEKNAIDAVFGVMSSCFLEATPAAVLWHFQYDTHAGAAGLSGSFDGRMKNFLTRDRLPPTQFAWEFGVPSLGVSITTPIAMPGGVVRDAKTTFEFPLNTSYEKKEELVKVAVTSQFDGLWDGAFGVHGLNVYDLRVFSKFGIENDALNFQYGMKAGLLLGGRHLELSGAVPFTVNDMGFTARYPDRLTGYDLLTIARSLVPDTPDPIFGTGLPLSQIGIAGCMLSLSAHGVPQLDIPQGIYLKGDLLLFEDTAGSIEIGISCVGDATQSKKVLPAIKAKGTLVPCQLGPLQIEKGTLDLQLDVTRQFWEMHLTTTYFGVHRERTFHLAPDSLFVDDVQDFGNLGQARVQVKIPFNNPLNNTEVCVWLQQSVCQAITDSVWNAVGENDGVAAMKYINRFLFDVRNIGFRGGFDNIALTVEYQLKGKVYNEVLARVDILGDDPQKVVVDWLVGKVLQPLREEGDKVGATFIAFGQDVYHGGETAFTASATWTEGAVKDTIALADQTGREVANGLESLSRQSEQTFNDQVVPAVRQTTVDAATTISKIEKEEKVFEQNLQSAAETAGREIEKAWSDVKSFLGL